MEARDGAECGARTEGTGCKGWGHTPHFMVLIVTRCVQVAGIGTEKAGRPCNGWGTSRDARHSYTHALWLPKLPVRALVEIFTTKATVPGKCGTPWMTYPGDRPSECTGKVKDQTIPSPQHTWSCAVESWHLHT